MKVQYTKNQMQGLFASNQYKKDSTIAKIEGRILSEATRYSYQILPDKHIESDSELKYVNHHCMPNAYIKDISLIANRDIEIGEEITFDYNSNEDCLSNPFICNCCGKQIKGKKFEHEFSLHN